MSEYRVSSRSTLFLASRACVNNVVHENIAIGTKMMTTCWAFIASKGTHAFRSRDVENLWFEWSGTCVA